MENKSNKYITLIIIALIFITITAAILKNNRGAEVVNISDQGFFIKNDKELQNILNSGKPSLITYGSEACPPCVQLKKDLLEVREEFNDVNIYYIEVTETPELIKAYDIQMTPSVLIFDHKGSPYDNLTSRLKRSGVDLYVHKKGIKTDHVSIQYIPQKEDLIEVLKAINGDN